MSKSQTLSKDDVLHLAKLASLHLSDIEIDKITGQLEETISYVENLKELDTTNTAETHNASSQDNVYFADGTANTRSLSAEDLALNGSNMKDSFYVVHKILSE